MASGNALSQWLRQEMPRRGYPLEGPRAGGLSRLADDAGISRSSLSRIVSGEAEPSMETLRALGRVFQLSLGAMMVHAGFAEPDDIGQAELAHPDPAAWKRVGGMLHERRQQLGIDRPEELADGSGLRAGVITDLETGRQQAYSVETIAVAESAYRIAQGSIRDALDRPDLTEFPHRIGSATVEIPWSRGVAPHLSSVPDIQLGAPGDPDPRDVIPGDPISAEKGEVQIWSMTTLPWEIRRDLIKHLRWLDQQYKPDQRQPGRRRENGTEG
jgi:transcriptional regulator with XRE-family HTH domain